MIYLILVLLGLSLGSFINALVWRVYKQEEVFASKSVGMGKKTRELSIVRGRSMCLHCEHELAPMDLIPVVSWLWLRGKCRYCGTRFEDTPITELLMPLLLVVSYLFWPYAQNGWGIAEGLVFVLWSLILTCLLALTVYDIRWKLLPDRIVLPLTIFAIGFVITQTIIAEEWSVLVMAGGSAAIISGLFYVIALLNPNWIGGGDVKLAVSLGLLAGTPVLAVGIVFIASLLGTIVALPGLLLGRKSMKTELPYGPYLILATFIMVLWGEWLFDWYFGLLV